MTTLPIDINASTYQELTNIFSVDSATKIISWRQKKGLFTRKQALKDLIGYAEYTKLKHHIILSLPVDLMGITNPSEFLTQLAKYNDDKINEDIKKHAKSLQNKRKEVGYNYILKNPNDKYVKWYKVGETKNEPSKRANEWKYDLKWFRLSSCRKNLEIIIHKHLNFAHSKRLAMHGKGKYEIEWFYLPYDLLVKTIDAVITIYDPYGPCFELFNIKNISDFDKETIKTNNRKLKLKYHPDKVTDPNEKKSAEQIFKKIEPYYEKLLQLLYKKEYSSDSSNTSATDANKPNSSTKNPSNFYNPFTPGNSCFPNNSTNASKPNTVYNSTKSQYTNILTKDACREIDRIIATKWNSSYFRVGEKRYLFSIILQLYRIDKGGSIQSLEKQRSVRNITEFYDPSSQYFHVAEMAELFRSILAYMNHINQ